MDEAWEKVKDYIDQLPDPPISNLVMGEPRNEGTHGKENHTLMKFEYVLPEVSAIERELSLIKPFRAVYAYAYCPECEQTIWKRISAYYEKTPGRAYVRKL